MHASYAALLIAAAAFVAAPLSAQEASADKSPAADLLLMRYKASADPDLQSLFQEFEGAIRDSKSTDQIPNPRSIVRNYVFRNVGVRAGMARVSNSDEPVRISTLEALEPARQRAEAVSQVLAADLDGDWQITRDELLEIAKYQRIDWAAQAFLTSDADRNDVLSFDEIKAAVDELVAIVVGRGGMPPSLMPVFDFDGDGYLTRAELDRGTAAVTP